MNKILLSFIIYCAAIFQVSSQDYQLFFTNRTYIYEFEYSGQSHFTVFKADTFYLSGTDTIFSNYARTNDDDLFGIPANGSDYLSDTSWSGYKVIVSVNGDNILLNRRSDSLIFKCNDPAGSSWTFARFNTGEYYKATIISVSNDSVFNLLDSVKTITLQRYDSSANPMSDSLNGFQFRISKNYGLLSTLNVKHFPNRTWLYQLHGIESVLGEQLIAPESIFNFDIGNVFHYNKYTHVSLSVDRWEYEKRKILSKTINVNTIVYTIEDSVYTLETGPGGYVNRTLTGNVISETYSRSFFAYDSLCSKMPQTAFMFTQNNYMTTWHRSIENRRAIYTIPCIERPVPYVPCGVLRSTGGCNGSSWSFPGGSNWFVEGLGLFNHYSSLDSASSVYQSINNLVYFEKGNDVYGIPITFPVITSTEEHESLSGLMATSQQGSMKVFFASKTATNYEIKLSDLNGRIIFKSEINANAGTNQYTLPIEIDPGLYFICLENLKSRFCVKFISEH